MSEPSIIFLSFFSAKKKSGGESLLFFSAAVCDNIPADNTLKERSKHAKNLLIVTRVILVSALTRYMLRTERLAYACAFILMATTR